jgi:hypothetical protein
MKRSTYSVQLKNLREGTKKLQTRIDEMNERRNELENWICFSDKEANEIHVYVTEFPFIACRNCGKHSVMCTCHHCKSEKK